MRPLYLGTAVSCSPDLDARNGKIVAYACGNGTFYYVVELNEGFYAENGKTQFVTMLVVHPDDICTI